MPGKIVTYLWFDGQAVEAARLYTSLFPGSGIDTELPYAETGGGTPGTVMTVSFHLGDQPYVALNGGPMYQFTEAISLFVPCASQEEVDFYWDALGAGGTLGPCGWLKDRFGLSWQIVPTRMMEMLQDPDPARVNRVTTAFLAMTKLELPALEAAYAGA